MTPRIARMLICASLTASIVGATANTTLARQSNASRLESAGSAWGIARGFNGDIWYTAPGLNKIGQIGPTGKITFYAIPTAGSEPRGIAASQDGSVWFAEYAGNKIGHLSVTGKITEFKLKTANAGPYAMIRGLDGGLWCTELNAGRIDHISPAGVITSSAIPTHSARPAGIAQSQDGGIWFSESGANKIGRFFSGTFKEYVLPTANATPEGVAAPSGTMVWFAEQGASKIGAINILTGKITEYALPRGSSGSGPVDLARGPYNTVWYTRPGSGTVGYVLANGAMREYSLGSGSSPRKIVFDGFANLLITEGGAARIGKISLSGKITSLAL